MRSLRSVRSPLALLAWLAAGFTSALLLAVIVSLLLGERAVIVLSGSMEPAFSPGDALIERPVEPGEVKIGQIVTFTEPDEERMITHRVRRIESRDSQLVFTTKGDADNGQQRWAIEPNGTLWTPAWRIPAIGYLAMATKRPLGLIGIVLLPLLLVAGWEIYRIWRPSPAPRIPTEVKGARL